MNKNKKILAIETSCDETAMAVLDLHETDVAYDFEILSNVVASQIDLHKKWGGVYPELASRAHLEAIIPVLEEALEPIGGLSNFSREIDEIAVTKEPGLIGSLLMGIETAELLGAFYKKSVVEVNHLEGHIYSAFCNQDRRQFSIKKSDIFPILALVVSGGHTSLILMKEHLKYQTIGQTIDDAAGEAFDKVARIMNLGYPGGPVIEKIAQSGDEKAYELPQGLKNSRDLNFSFSGLKTSVLYKTKDIKTGQEKTHNKADMAASFQKAVADILIKKTLAAKKKYNPKTIILGGGVSANGYLRNNFRDKISTSSSSQSGETQILIPPRNLSTDNAVGIAIAGAIK
ncbi:MAG: tRNA N6-adenosine threonylcarbamoyltransferase [candidate division WS2 bacterium ADurb.Bin280]|uniref:tRNA N6-adenosine threonylcarbamoyltransferase n=1 Tax=candidate division WS2 bacterium ADurb.Bin280 TaxID=1852829 RepID=A0A1V5SD60_9BACT|nr:MAG: tRNA N6-adenosine threonylcarbamoyltransferase [candidate division WS2 bacterium ADurb.Bin280]